MVPSWVETIPPPGFALDKLCPCFIVGLQICAELARASQHQLYDSAAVHMRSARSEDAIINMVLTTISKFELFPGKIILLLVFSAFLAAALHISCFVYRDDGCSACAVPGISCGRISDANVASSYNENIYAVSTTTEPTAISRDNLRMDVFGTRTDPSMSLKPLYNLKFRGHEHLISINLKLKTLWTSKDWRLKVSTFTDIFSALMKKNLLKPCFKALCIGAGQGHEVLALKEMGIYDSIGIDLVAAPPLVMKGDMHSQPFREETFDFEYCNVFDHALLTSKFAAEIERTLKPGGSIVIHLMLKNRPQEAFRLNNLQDVAVLIALFRNFEHLHVGDIDTFGLDTEVIFRKPFLPKEASSAAK
ncbi:hypothetical protein GOP47_0019381 [Adiantum capillus-veneris]|uniref:Methyltransferase type 11 domain-containing protein n=1 Tax=Adiantum capillus-veneris TaxID=13818 RepID=A0A9D4UAZ0_ADICA|nr:hypothetical protein GOP47_0019381 [Adiantum capillus-veneris]